MARDETTFYETPKADPRDLIQVEIGDSKQPEFFPQIKMMRHGNEGNLSVRLIDHGEDFTPVVGRDGRVTCEGEKLNIDLYQIEPNDDHPEGASEFEITLLEKPASNVIQFSINTKGLRFLYQPELTQEELELGMFRPENVVGSYAVYYAEPKLNITGGQKYRSGKAFHWYRPRIEDSKGDWVWGELNIDAENGIASVTIPQDFLDKASYPVRHAAGATFGYTSVGGSNFTTTLGNTAFFSKGTPPSAGDVESISVYGSSSASANFKPCLWKKSDKTLITNGSGPAKAYTGTDSWTTANYSTLPAVTTIDYWVGYVADGNSAKYFYDAGSSGDGGYTSGANPNSYSSPTNLGAIFQFDYLLFSVYATLADAVQYLDLSGSLTPAGTVKKLTATTKVSAITPTSSIIRSVTRRITASLTPAAAIARFISRRLSGSMTPAGSIVAAKTTAVSFTGTITPTGTAAKQARKPLGGSLTPTGDVEPLTVNLLSLASSLTPSGIVTKLASISAAGTLTPSGIAAKLVSRTLTAAIGFAGAVETLLIFLLSLGGSITPSSVLVRAVSAIRGSGITPTGTAAKRTAKPVSSSLPSSGSVARVKQATRTLGSSITPASSIVRSVTRRLTGSLTPSAIIAKLARKTVGGVITPASVVATLKLFTRNFTGTITPAGTIIDRQLGIPRSGTLAMAGNIAKLPIKTLSSAISLAGSIATRLFGVIVYWKTRDEAEATWTLSDE